jgi:protein-tyrosine phosphatase
MENQFKATHELAWRDCFGGRLSIGHRPGKAVLSRLRHLGVSGLFTILSEREGANLIRDACLQSGVKWYGLPLDSAAPPDRELFPNICAAFEWLRAELASGGSIYMHCSAGLHRTGMIAYGFLRFLGVPPSDAETELRAMRSLTWESIGSQRIAWSENFLDDVARQSLGRGPQPP